VRTEEDAASARAFVAERLAAPVTPDAAVMIALINNPGLQARYAELGIVESERERLVAAQTLAAAEALKVAAKARRAAILAIAAVQSVRYYEQALTAAEASAELARQMAAVGNWNKVSQMRQQIFHADATAQLARARSTAVLARERLARVLGVAATPEAIKLPERLPEIPAQPRDERGVAAIALAQRLDVRIARAHLDDAKAAKAEAVYRRAANELAAAAGNAQSEARAAYDVYRTAYDLARHYRDEIVPLRKRIADENLLRYNGMLISVFELLADAREQVMSVNAAIEAQRDFWLADADLQMALTGSSAAH
jgi:outer membrane protein TolC